MPVSPIAIGRQHHRGVGLEHRRDSSRYGQADRRAINDPRDLGVRPDAPPAAALSHPGHTVSLVPRRPDTGAAAGVRPTWCNASMSMTIRDQSVGELRWVVLRGPADGAFRALGEHIGAEISAFLDRSVLLPGLRRHVAAEPGRQRLAAVRAATQAECPQSWQEVAALAAGAGVSLDDLAAGAVRAADADPRRHAGGHLVLVPGPSPPATPSA
jgi:hypothetical protein